jgi:hypothetical protein
MIPFVLFQVLSVIVTILAGIGFSILTPINMLKTEKGRKEASEGDEVLLEGITCTYFTFWLIRDITRDNENEVSEVNVSL